jgi:uncharacterized repeat protein (TIGR03803 family)
MKSTLLALLLLLPLMAGAQTYTYSTLLNMPPSSDLGPVGVNQLTIDPQGNLYGTSSGGGVYCAPFGCGTVFEVSPAGVLTVLHSFSGPDGNSPRVGVTRDSAGNLYGETFSGGAGVYYGTLYKVAPDGTETVLYSFPNKPPAGNYPDSPITIDPKGNLLSYTSFTDNNFVTNGGSIFKFTQPETFAVKYTFAELGSGPYGTGPVGALIRDKAGNYYGANCCNDGGTVFKITPDWKVSLLYTFNVFTDPVWEPQGSLVLDASGNAYGVGLQGIYEILASGGETAFYVFPSGVHPDATLIIDSAGNIYGVDQNGGTSGYGAVYKISPEGVETDIYSVNFSDGGYGLNDGLVMDQAGNLYGTTYYGGTNDAGSVYKLTKTAE